MALKNDPDLLAYAQQGFEATPFDGLEYSTVWYAWRAGSALSESGRTKPLKCAASRGRSIRLETSGGMELKVHFDKKTDEVIEIERINS